jgi:hypothetical protein
MTRFTPTIGLFTFRTAHAQTPNVAMATPIPILDPSDYTIAWIAVLQIEAEAAVLMLDRQQNGRFSMQRGNDCVFFAGDMCGHNVIIATLPEGREYGTGSTAALASQVKSFPNLWFGLLVGVAACQTICTI